MIKIDNISKKYGIIKAVDNINFTIDRGEIVGFIGANGAGKSTTMKIITGILLADKGKVSVFGKNVAENPVEAKKRIGYLSEDNPLPETMYVKEYLEYIAHIYKLDDKREKIDGIIETTGLKNEYKKKINALSKGNRQKLGLAQALIHNPDFLVLDEATSSLDPNQQDEILELIENAGKSKIILFSTHHLREADKIATRAILLQNGKIVTDKKLENETVEELFYSMQNEDSSR